MKENHFVHLRVEAVEAGYWKIKEREPFNYETNIGDETEFTSVAAGASSGFKNIVNLEPSDLPKHIYQIRWGVLDGFNYYIKIPTGTDRLGIDKDKDIGFINNQRSPAHAKNEDYEFWLRWAYYPAINAKSEREKAYVAGTPKVYFEGMKYSIEEIKEAEDPQTVRRLKNFEEGRPDSIPVRKVVIGGLVGGSG